MKAHQLKSFGNFKFFSRIRHLAVRKDNSLFLGKMKYNPLPAQLGIPTEHTKKMIERQGKPAAVFPRIQINIRVHKDGKQHEQRPEEERIHKKFAHIRNMGEFSEIMKFNRTLVGLQNEMQSDKMHLRNFKKKLNRSSQCPYRQALSGNQESHSRFLLPQFHPSALPAQNLQTPHAIHRGHKDMYRDHPPRV